MSDFNLFTFAELNKPRVLIHKRELKPVNNLKLIFRNLRDYLAGNLTGITRGRNDCAANDVSFAMQNL